MARPNGYGFAITGNWKQTLTFIGKAPSRLTASTYTVTGSVTLQTALGPLSLHVPTRKTFTVTTKPSTFGSVFGEVKSIVAELEGSLDDYTDPFTAQFDKLGAFIKLTAPEAKWEIQLGSQIRG